ncbi:MAG: LicD family protein [Varibaculum sp.]|nr:LicD family protein [Varibaculum sp.]
MGFLSRIKSKLPVTNSGFSHFENEFWRSNSELHSKLGETKWLVEQVLQDNQQLRETISDLNDHNHALSTHLDLYAWELLHRDSEDISETKRRFFKNLSPAQGDLRLLQLATARLLTEFDELCRKNDLRYWICFGTLLGAVRHGGFIPWDDDTDLGMMRGEIRRLIAIVDSEERYRVSIVWDSYARSRQVRFMYANENLPCFLDLFIFDYATSLDPQLFDIQAANRTQLVKRLTVAQEYGFWGGDNAYLPDSDPRAEILRGAFDELHHQQIESGLLAEDENRAAGIIWGLDNLEDLNHYKWLVPVSDVFPTVKIVFEGVECAAPNQGEQQLSDIYGDIWRLPDDIVSHFDHVSRAELREPDVRSALKMLVDSAANCAE